jgi:hypothetical protein
MAWLVNALSLWLIGLIMGRELSEKDKEILKRLVPELKEMQEQGIEIEYMNILPPLANHHSKDEKDFERRLKTLSTEDMRYLSDRVLDGTESLCCLYPEFAEVFFTVAGQRLSSEVADQLREAYASGGDCGG